MTRKPIFILLLMAFFAPWAAFGQEFITDGYWNDGSCWDTGTVPSPGNDVVIRANVTIPAGYTAIADFVDLYSVGSITIEDGGQLRHNTSNLRVTMKKNIMPYTEVNGTSNYHLLAFPFSEQVAVPAAMTATEGYDFYKFDPNKPFAEWRNNRQQAVATVGGTTGYLYANPEPIVLSLTGRTYPSFEEESRSVTVPYTGGSSNLFNGWALLGNPFTCEAYVYSFDYELFDYVPMEVMVYNANGRLVTLNGGPIRPMQGFFVKVTQTTTVYIENHAISSFHYYVDLGLPSGTLWATTNVGANAPEDYGDYFAWAETTTKEIYSWDTYQYCNGSNTTLSKYCNNSSYGYNGYTDDLTTLLPEDDAATANWGNGWRMPTKEEWQELYNNTTVTWTTQNGVNGRLFTASNGNCLFLPAAGERWHSSHYNASSCGYYWSTSLYTDIPDGAWYLYFGSGNYYMDYDFFRYSGLSVRAVRNTYHITVMALPNNGGTVTGTGNYEYGQSCTVIAMPNEGYVFANWTENGEVVSTDATYTFTVEGNRNLVANFATYIGGHEYVDLGLPSGTLWATCNVGADTPEAYGDYFAWGETQPKEYYGPYNYQHCNGSSTSLTKYCNNSSYGYNGFTDNLTTLLPEDDAATANWGNGWRMPTQAEFQELLDNTTVTWTTQNGVNGRLFTASNGNSLFLPAAGNCVYSGLNNAGSSGRYWSSSLDTDSPDHAWNFLFNSNYYYMGNGLLRFLGFSVRPVCSSQN